MVRQRSAKPRFPSSNLGAASKKRMAGERHPLLSLTPFGGKILPFLETEDDESAGLRHGLILFCPFLEKTGKLFLSVGISLVKECDQPN